MRVPHLRSDGRSSTFINLFYFLDERPSYCSSSLSRYCTVLSGTLLCRRRRHPSAYAPLSGSTLRTTIEQNKQVFGTRLTTKVYSVGHVSVMLRAVACSSNAACTPRIVECQHNSSIGQHTYLEFPDRDAAISLCGNEHLLVYPYARYIVPTLCAKVDFGLCSSNCFCCFSS